MWQWCFCRDRECCVVWCSCFGRDTTVKLGRKVEDLEDVRYLVNILNEVRGCIGY
jgi:hypothetical protein